MELSTLQLRMSLFESLVSPVLVYCSEVWGPTLLRSCSQPSKCLDLPMHHPLFIFLRRLGGNLRRSTKRELLMREFGAKPLARAWLRASVQLWNRVPDLDVSDPLYLAMHENVSMAYRPKQLWSVGLESFLRHIRYELPEGGLRSEGNLVALSVPDVLNTFDQWWCAAYGDSPMDPRQAPTSVVSLCTYERWFAMEPVTDSYCSGGWASVPDYVSHTAGIPSAHVRSLAAFRLGAHSFEVATGRWCNRPRCQRVCHGCG